jgi:uncharacterized NAD-dependent epimerase/dehydratase family protein
MINLKSPYLLFIGDVTNPISSKTARGIADFSPEKCIGYNKLPSSTVTIDSLAETSIEKAAKNGAKTMIIGLANSGGYISDTWIDSIIEAAKFGMDIASGLHKKLSNIPKIADAAKKYGIKLHDVRHFDGELRTANGKKRSGKKILAVGTDCSVGKMYTALTLTKSLNESGKKAHFVATGQTGIFIAGSGIAIDNVPADFMSGAIEMITPSIAEDQYYVIEGQGSLFHPSFAGISLALLHGAAPDYLILCHDPARKHMRHLPDYPVVSLEECMDLNLKTAKLTNKNVKFIGISCNTSSMSEDGAKKYLLDLERKYNLPATDSYRFKPEILKNQASF